MLIYLCGPINGRTDEDAKGWREAVKELWKGGTLDPMRRDYRGKEHEPGAMQAIIKGDIQDLLDCDAVLLFFDRPSVGTSQEMVYAKFFGKPVVVVDAQDKPLSPWLIYHSDKVVRSVREACEYLLN